MADPSSTIILEPLIYAASVIKGQFQLWKGCEDDVKLLQSNITTIRGLLEDAKDRQGAAALTEDLLQKLKDVDDDAEDLLSTIQTDEAIWKNQKVRKFFLKISTSNASEIKLLLARIEVINAEKSRYNPSGFENLVGSSYKFCPPKSSDGPADITVGRETDINKVISMVSAKRDTPIIVSIIGEGGVGKTTLARAVFNHPRAYTEGDDDECFAFRIWISVTNDFDYRRILKEILEYSSEMKYDMNALSDNELESRLIKFLGSYHFLLVLDDVGVNACRRLLKLTDLIIGKFWKGSILITSRSMSVSEQMGIRHTHSLNPLGGDESHSLFKQPMIQENSGEDFHNVGKLIVSKCNGLPLLVKAVGGLLSCFTDLEKWKEISKHRIWKGEGESSHSARPIARAVLKLCYDHLPSHLKKCFTYCHVFPKGYLFQKSELLKLWKSSSLIHPEHGRTIDEIARSNFDQLLRMSFFQHHRTGDKERFQMHDLVQELAESVSNSYFCQVKDSERNRTSVRSRYASILCEDIEGASLEIIKSSKKLRALLLPRKGHKGFGKSLEEIFRNLKYMRILDLSCNALIKLPDSVCRLKLLHYLDLSNNDMKELPNSICSLLNLQTLKLLGCPWLLGLPEDFSNLTNLENLDLDDTFWSKSPSLPPNMGRLVRLKNLHAFQIRRQSGYGVDELKGMTRLTETLHISKLENAESAPAEANLINKGGLNKLVLEWSDINQDSSLLDRAADEEVLKSLKPHPNLKALKIIGYRGTSSPSPYELWIGNGFLTNLVSLSLNKCSKCKVLSLGMLVKLQELEIVGMSELEQWTDRRHDFLDTLTISNCPKLRELPGCTFHTMSALKIENCASLKTLPVTPYVNFLVLVNNPVLQHVPHQSMDPSSTGILEIKIINCPKLPALRLHYPPEKLEISECDSELPRSLLIPEFTNHLEHLSLDGFHVEALWPIPDTRNLLYLVISNISGLACLPTLPYSRGLKALYIHHCPDLVSISEDEESPFQGLPSLQILSLWNNAQLVTLPERGLPASITCLSIGKCRRLRSLGPCETLHRLRALKDLHLMACPLLQSFPEEGLPDSLVHLHIEGCQELSKQCQKDGGAEWEKIRHIPDLEIEHTMENPIRSIII